MLVFIHQDVLFESKDSLKKFQTVIQERKDILVGPFGASRHSPEKICGGLFKADTLDECCAAMHRKTWQRLQFNETLCDGWHLYVAEFCLRAAGEGITSAYGYFGIQHLSYGNVYEQYMCTFKKLLVKYRDRKWISTTCKTLPTNLVVYYLYYWMWKCKKILFGNFPLRYSAKTLLDGSKRSNEKSQGRSEGPVTDLENDE